MNKDLEAVARAVGEEIDQSTSPFLARTRIAQAALEANPLSAEIDDALAMAQGDYCTAGDIRKAGIIDALRARMKAQTEESENE